MSKIPWNTDLYETRDREAASLCDEVLVRLGCKKRAGHPVLTGCESHFIRVLAEYGWHLPYAEEVGPQVALYGADAQNTWRAATENFSWVAGLTLEAAGQDATSLSLSVKGGTGRSWPTRGKFSFRGRSGAVRVGDWGVGAGIEFAMQLGLPEHSVVSLFGIVDGALDRFAWACLPDRVIEALSMHGLLEEDVAARGAVDDEAVCEQHNRVGLWCGVMLREKVNHVRVSWDTPK